MPPDIPAAKLRPVPPRRRRYPGHVLAAMIAHPSTTAMALSCGRRSVRRQRRRNTFTGDGTVHHGVADDDVFERIATEIRTRFNDDAPAESPLPT